MPIKDTSSDKETNRFGFIKAQFWGLEPYQKEIWKPRQSEIFFNFAKKIYHYTDLHGLIGILESRGVWASHIRYMNDSAEYRHGRDLAIKLIEKLMTKGHYNFIDNILNEVLLNLKDETLPEYYIACFSRNGDSLDQWRGYCQNDGVSIELTLGQDNIFNSPFMVAPVMTLDRVLYDTFSKHKSILLKIKRLIHEYFLDKNFYGERFQSYIDEHMKEYAKVLTSNLEHMFLRFKDPAFANEEEVRLVIESNAERDFYKRRYRATKNFIIPYYSSADLKLKDSDGKLIEPKPLPITAVTIGPSAHQKLKAISIEEYLRHNGYKDVEVRLSTVPYRSL